MTVWKNCLKHIDLVVSFVLLGCLVLFVAEIISLIFFLPTPISVVFLRNDENVILRSDLRSAETDSLQHHASHQLIHTQIQSWSSSGLALTHYVKGGCLKINSKVFSFVWFFFTLQLTFRNIIQIESKWKPDNKNAVSVCDENLCLFYWG